MSQAKERPILFSGPMVRAIVSGQKTVTRRAMKNQPCRKPVMVPNGGANFWTNPLYIQGAMMGSQNHGCPYGQPGDRLWVRETCFINDYRDAKVPVDERANVEVVYRADPLPDWEGEESLITWRPSIHMPRWASRILLEITDVRVERLQDISEHQALAEGIVGVDFRPDDGFPICRGYMVGPDDGSTPLETHASKAFAGLWRSINGPDSWDANPWVWVVEFKRVTP